MNTKIDLFARKRIFYHYKNSILCCLACVMYASFSLAQLKKIKTLDPQLSEISGLCSIGDSLLVAHNDSGNEPVLFMLNVKGELQRKVFVKNAKNIDWEDIAVDSAGTIVIADIGNNSNKRKNLALYLIAKNELVKDTVSASKVEISYEDQRDFPPSEKDLHFDAEALTFFQNKWWIFTKSQTVPFDGKTDVYSFELTDSKQIVAKKDTTLQLKHRKFRKDAVTAVVVKDSLFYILTYSGIEVFARSNGKFEHQKRISFQFISQREAMTRVKDTFFIGSEQIPHYSKAKLYQLK